MTGFVDYGFPISMLTALGLNIAALRRSSSTPAQSVEQPVINPRCKPDGRTTEILPSAKAAYDRLSTAAQIALSVIYRESLGAELRSGYPTTTLEVLRKYLEALGYASPKQFDTIISELTATNLVKRDHLDNLEASSSQAVADSVRQLLVTAGMPSLDMIDLLMNEARRQSSEYLREIKNLFTVSEVNLKKQLISAEQKAEVSKERAALEMIKVQIEGILAEYKHLDHDHRDEVKLPLNNSSWPNFGSPWDYVDFRLAALNAHLDLLTKLSRELFERNKWKSEGLAIFKLQQVTKMLDVQSALEQFLNWKPSSWGAL